MLESACFLLSYILLGNFILTSLRSAIVRFIPASCFHTGSAKLRLRGLPVRIAMPKSTPVSLNIIFYNFFC